MQNRSNTLKNFKQRTILRPVTINGALPAVLSDLSSNSNLSSSPSGLPLDGKDDHNPIPDLGDALDDFF
jgi:hypothetical protein